MAFAPQGLPRITEWKKKIGNIPLVGIGGITLARVAGVLEAGADSAAVVTDISLNVDPEARTRNWVKATRGFRA
jgi:thiamine-phosphate pyrophosphorylase